MSNLTQPSKGNSAYSISTVAKEIVSITSRSSNKITKAFYKAVPAEEFFQNEAVIEGYLHYSDGQKNLDRAKEDLAGMMIFVHKEDQTAYDGALSQKDVESHLRFAKANPNHPDAKQAPKPYLFAYSVLDTKRNSFRRVSIGMSMFHNDGFAVFKGWEQKEYEVIVTFGFFKIEENDRYPIPRKYQADVQSWNNSIDTRDENKIIFALEA